MTDFYKPYYDEYFRLIYPENIHLQFEEFKKLALRVKKNNNKLIKKFERHEKLLNGSDELKI